MLQYGGRPHLSKLIYLEAADMQKIYPALGMFLKVRRRLDPDNVFYTERLARLFG